jgi:DNA polymerase-3 subunit gamma/tau
MALSADLGIIGEGYMAHIALYRTWRPQLFEDVVGQKHIVQTLQNSLKEGRLSHAYLFSGPRGTGKTSAAKILAKAVNCEEGPAIEPCNHCAACMRITDGAVMDVIEIDAASNRGVEEIRDIRDKVKYAPTEVRQKVYIIDEVHMLTTEAFNALLKTLEEPPAHVMFILATTEPHKLPATIISRCQRFDFRRVALADQVERLAYVCSQENVTVEADAMQYIARLSEGGMRDALSLLDQIVSYSGNHVTYENVVLMTGGIAADQFEQLAQAIRDKDIGDALQRIDGFMQEGKSAEKCIESLIYYFRDLLMIKMVPESQAVTDRILDVSRFVDISSSLTTQQLFEMIEVLNHYQVEMKYSSQPQTLLEVAILKICSTDSIPPLDLQQKNQPTFPISEPSDELAAMKRKLEQLEQQISHLTQLGQVGAAAASAPMKSTASAVSVATNQPSLAMKNYAVKLDGFIREQESPLFKQVLLKWSQVLAQVKEQKITVHAWLVNGDPVSLQQDTILLAFKSSMHRETTEKPANKMIIERVVAEVYGHPMSLVTVMQKDWKDAQDISAEAPEQILQLEPEEPGTHKEEWIHQAIQLFGEDLVKIKED